MRGADLLIASVWPGHRDEIVAGATLLVALALAEVVDGMLKRRGRGLAAVLPGGGVSAVADTRLRLIRRLVFIAIVLVGSGLALSQFDQVRRLATGVLASSAVLGLVVGFAARQTLANAIAGILIAISQPIRIGDLVTFEERTGTVEDIRLTYTFIKAGDGSRVIVPNERLAQATIQNHTIVDPRVHVEISLWLPPGANAARALTALEGQPGVEVEIADVEKDGIRLTAAAWAETPDERGALAARIRGDCLERLRSEGLFSEARL
jgi:small-conductance mechanosensitive channel